MLMALQAGYQVLDFSVEESELGRERYFAALRRGFAGDLGPTSDLFTEILKRTESANWAILSLLVFFAVGWAIIAPLDIARGQRDAREGLDATGS